MLVIGYGNTARGDDGLGPAFVDALENAGLPDIATDIDFQLTVDHALMIAGTDRVVFVDADMSLDTPFEFSHAGPAQAGSLSSHSLSPGDVLALSKTLFGATPEAFTLGIAGADFGQIDEGLSDLAQQNLDLALEAFLRWASTAVRPGTTAPGLCPATASKG